MGLVYAVRGGAETVVPLSTKPRATSVTGRHTLYLEDLHVQPGDFVSYYVRASDITHGTRSRETKSDIYFLEVKPFEQEFRLAQTQAPSGDGGKSIDDLVAAQKEIVVATWKLDRRAEGAGRAPPAPDYPSVPRGLAQRSCTARQTNTGC